MYIVLIYTRAFILQYIDKFGFNCYNYIKLTPKEGSLCCLANCLFLTEVGPYSAKWSARYISID